MKFLETIDLLIQEKGINRNILSKEVDGLTHNSFYAWSTRGTIPSAEVLSKIADYFGVTTDYLLGNETNTYNSLTEEQQKVLEYYDRLCEEDKDYIKGEMVKLFKNQTNKQKSEFSKELA